MPKILVIDDKMDNLVIMSALLKNLMPDCAMVSAQSGMGGIEKAKAELPDAILLDIKMPDMDGFETCRRLKAGESTRHIPVIMVTAMITDPESRIKGMELGADAFLAKPIDEYELVSQLKVALRIKKVEDALREERNFLEKTVLERTASLYRSEEMYRSLFENMIEGFAYCRMLFDGERPLDFIYLKVNRAFESLTGLKNVTGKRVSEVIPDIGDSDPEWFQIYGRVALTGKPERFEMYLNALEMWLSVSAYCPEKEHFVVVFDVITERKQAEEESELMVRLMQLLNAAGERRDLMRSVTALLQHWTGCEAVGIRLREGEDYPYYETCGFPAAFILKENQLCSYDLQGQILRDSVGKPLLECMCGNVLCCRFDPAQPFFTVRGSFWSNCTTALLAATTEADRQARTRNRCNGEGYESVALIPLRTVNQVFGLLQFNDHRPDRFTPARIALFERLADSLAIALSQRQTEEVLREREKLLNDVQRLSRVGGWTYDVAKQRVTWTEEVYRIHEVEQDYDPSDIEKAVSFYSEEDQPLIAQAFWNAVHAAEPYDLELRFNAAGGIKKWVRTLGIPTIAEGKVINIIGNIMDVTERKRAEEEKRSLEQRLQRSEKMEALGELAGGVAHDMNNVLGVLMAYSEILMDTALAGTPSKEYASHILRATEKAAAIIQDLLTLARRGVVTSKVVDLNSIVSNFLATPEFDRLQTYHPRITIKMDLEKDMLNIKASPVHLEKTMMNLVSNAAEAIAGSGEVKIRTENRYLDRAVQGYDNVQEGEYVVLTISDTGTGISSEDVSKIFEPFFTKKTMGRSGTGLGLAIVWGTVKDHKGYIDVQSIMGKGTTFTLYFPVSREKNVEDVEKTPVEQYMGNGEAVLVVDDVQEQRQVATTLLMHLGYRVHAVSSGEEAVAYLQSNKADILVLDMIMEPGIDGLETYKRILEINPHQKAVIVSGFSESESVKEAQKLGAGVYVKKPYRKEKLGVGIRDELQKVT